MVNLYRIILPVTDIEKATVFYSTLFNMPGQRISAGRHYFDCGATILACYDPVADGDERGKQWQYHENQYIYFAVDDLDEVFRKAQSAGFLRLDEKIEIMPWGERLFYAQDPFGNPICFVDGKTMFTG